MARKVFSKILRSTRKNKKYMVHVRKDGKEKTVHFGDPNMRIRRNNPGARKSFLARHKPTGDRFSARYWARKAWDPKTKLP